MNDKDSKLIWESYEAHHGTENKLLKWVVEVVKQKKAEYPGISDEDALDSTIEDFASQYAHGDENLLSMLHSITMDDIAPHLTENEGIEDDFAEFADENPNEIWSFEGTENLNDAKAAYANIPEDVRVYFEPTEEEVMGKKYYDITYNEQFANAAEKNPHDDSMGGVSEYSVGGVVVGMEDGNFLRYIKKNPTGDTSLKLRRPPR